MDTRHPTEEALRAAGFTPDEHHPAYVDKEGGRLSEYTLPA